MDDEYEWSCSKEHHEKYRTIKLPRNHSKRGTIGKLFIKSNLAAIPENSNTFSDHMESNRLYSLNKKARWKLMEEFETNIESFNREDGEIRISAIERRDKFSVGLGRQNLNDVKSFHTVDKNGNPVHRYPSRAYANGDTLTNLEMYPSWKMRAQIRRQKLEEEQKIRPQETDEELKGHIMYEIVKPCTSVSLWEKQHKTSTRYQRRRKPVLQRPSFRDIMEDWDKEDVLTDCELSKNDEDENFNETDVDFVSNEPSWSQTSVDIMDLLQPQRERKMPKKDASKQINDANNFEMVPMKIQCPAEDLDQDWLKRRFGNNYYECPTIPRRFCIDISHTVTKVIPLSHKNSSKFLIKAMCIFEVVPPTLKDFKYIKWESEDDDDDEEFETNKVLFWINGHFDNRVKNLILRSIDLSSYHTVDSIVCESVKLVATLPSEYFAKKTNKLSNNQTEISIKSQISSDSSSSTSSWFSDIGENSCGLCMEWLVDNEGLCLSDCRHWFCKSCWYQYCNEQISNCSLPITCPEAQCEIIVDYDTLITILPIAQCYFARNLTN